MLIGVLSDTHGLLRPEAIAALRGCDHILHAGDVGAPSILGELRQIAPVTAVRGNVDDQHLPIAEVFEAAGVSIYMLHILQNLDLKPEAAGFHAVVYGHSHQPMQATENGVLYFNPGSAGPRRFKLPITVGRLIIEKGKLRGEIIPLPIR